MRFFPLIPAKAGISGVSGRNGDDGFLRLHHDHKRHGVLHTGMTDDNNRRALAEIPAFAGMSGKKQTPRHADGRAWTPDLLDLRACPG